MASEAPRVSRTTSSTFRFGHSCEAWQVKDWFETIPDHAKISADHYKGDQRDPAETTFSATWDPTKEQT